jgi:ribonucleoside-triphosphate reductase
MQYITKRDGRKVEFNKNKIVNAILKAFEQVDGEISDYAIDKANNIANFIAQNEQILSVEEIQDLVENGLMSTKRKDVARAYIRYRQDRSREREWNTRMMDKVADKLAAVDVQNQNANVDEYSFGGRRGEADSVIFKQYALDNLVSKMARDNHLNNEVYIHDLDAYILGMHNCSTIPFDKLLAEGFNTRQTDVRPAGSVNTAFQLVAVIFQLQSLQQFGGVSATHLDWTMVPYVRKSFAKHYADGWSFLTGEPIKEIDYEIDYMLKNATDYSIWDPEWEAYNYKVFDYAMKMTKKEIHQAVEGMYHNLNTLQS